MLKRLKKRPLDYFKHSFYADTAVFGGEPATHAGFEFYDLDKIVFASDCPFDPEKGTMYTRETLRILEGIDMPKADKEKIWHGNLEAHHGREVQELSALSVLHAKQVVDARHKAGHDAPAVGCVARPPSGVTFAPMALTQPIGLART